MDEGQHPFEWNDIYTGEAADYMEPDRELLQIVEGLDPGRALDVGCGAGGLVAALAERGWTVSGIDIAPNAIAAARKVLEERGLRATLEVADAANWKPEGHFDLITNSFALPGTQAEQASLFATMRDALAPGGRVLIKDFDSAMKSRPEFASYHCPSVDELLEAFDGFDILRAEVVVSKMHDHGEGHAHGDPDGPPPTAALLFARKPGTRSG